jgi:hypothetical protein
VECYGKVEEVWVEVALGQMVTLCAADKEGDVVVSVTD